MGTHPIFESDFDCLTDMPPVAPVTRAVIEGIVKQHRVVVFSKTWCPFCAKVKDLFKSKYINFFKVELDKDPQGELYQTILKEMTGQSSVPNVWINGNHVGGCDDTFALNEADKLVPMVNPKAAVEHEFDYDLVVIGGGSGGLAASKEAAALGKKVAVLDFVKPTPLGTQWGLGGTCVNVGCIPKKLMHTAALHHESQKDSVNYGWEYAKGAPTHSWEKMVQNVSDYIGGLNWGYRVELRDNSVDYVNAYGSLIDKNTIKTVDRKGREK